MDAIWQAECIEKFNALSRKPLAPGPSGLVPNVWHFDLRFIPFSPPFHILFLVQAENKLVAHQVLPIGKETNAPWLTTGYFPYNAEEAALDICFGLMHSFNTVFGQDKTPIGAITAPYGPWKLTTDDRSLAEAVETKFKALGVKGKRCKVDFTVDLTHKAHDYFKPSYRLMPTDANGFTSSAGDRLVAPISIAFSSLAQPNPEAWMLIPPSLYHGNTPEDKEFQQLIMYAHEFENSEPHPMVHRPSERLRSFRPIGERLEIIKAYITTVSLEQAKRKADAGDGFAAVDAALRLKYGIQCEPDRIISRLYLLKVALDENASAQHRTMAHSVLIFWYAAGREPRDFDPRDILATSYHANEAVRIASEGNSGPDRVFASAQVLQFARNIVKFLIDDFGAPQLFINFPWVVEALRQRQAALRLEQLVVERKMTKKPNRYRCANVGCRVESDSGKMLYKCSGSCDSDKKPSYCGKRCVFMDWKNHKPFCQPGAPCSVVDRITYSTSSVGCSAGGSIRVPLDHDNGKTSLLMSSTMDSEMLKEMGARNSTVLEEASLGENRSVKLDIRKINSSSRHYADRTILEVRY
ncbi:hypothetical protein F5878DRAFT_588084 [Lentinula raphanica]|uniref:MYND-type domain-containing protein n=1 Tax=Lentinula raphanica TaxID=153919 RepID=A0AA38UES9_9AGAR|nr:hypothetical protein F5880DRAFT_1472866 [Lentinula raphanica]KAJ3835427.1 hypothetical protein F5878DRAFT_588084 [Lentinula raphanica]